MKRWLVRICVFLLLGAIVNVAVAWGLVRFVDMSKWHSAPGKTDLQCPVGATAQGHGRASSTLGRSRCLLRLFSNVEATVLPQIESASHDLPKYSIAARQDLAADLQIPWSSRQSYFSDASGFPCLSLVTHYRLMPPDQGTLVWEGPDYGIELPGPRDQLGCRLTLPLMPIWPGFAINTVFYAAVLGALLLGPGMVRRALRQRRGLCPACGYPVGQSPVCTECGAAVSRIV